MFELQRVLLELGARSTDIEEPKAIVERLVV